MVALRRTVKEVAKIQLPKLFPKKYNIRREISKPVWKGRRRQMTLASTASCAFNVLLWILEGSLLHAKTLGTSDRDYSLSGCKSKHSLY